MMSASGGVGIDERTEAGGQVSGGHDYAALFGAESGRLYRSLYAYTGGRRDIAEDATVEAFARAISEGDRVRDPVRWLYRTAFRLAAAELKEDRTRGQRRDEPVDPPSLPHSEVLDAIRGLSDQQRSAVVMYYLAHLPVQEVARCMGVSASSVKVHLFRARRRLRELLGDEEVESVD
jgi:RNA polymerase sigma-70 factor (ECF subfamily)